ncbi:M15 family metallopeptidase [Mameliella sediminis]|uniref:M15 family metallopeptidase n=1 Tax=Mameliella sediminis TaxID=2836866 RepID=UPI001C445B1C|nr:M15 family metallopeptidase [Mameliella sediminis]MBV7395467.1 M15 family metallopeptidase [Mameliella sediminis]
MWKSVVAGLLVGLAAPSLALAQERGTAGPIPDATWTAMQGVSWHADKPCPARDDLRLLSVPYVDFKGRTRRGELIVATDVAEDMLDIFADIHAARYPIQSMRLVHHFRGDDGFSMAANNTSAFNCRLVAGTSRLSQHALGRAIDINPVQNPYVARGRTSPSAGVDFDDPTERRSGARGVIRAGDAVVAAFKKRGWGWGGDWNSSKDYQHFSANGN